MPTVHVAIVGLGQRGLSVLDRLAAFVGDKLRSQRLTLHLIDPGEPGEGLHFSDQPKHLLTNTSAGQITVYCDASVTDAGPCDWGESLQEWMNREGYRQLDGKVAIANGGRAVEFGTFVPRAVLGKYLGAMYHKIVASLPKNVIVRHARSSVVSITPCENGFCLALADDKQLEASYVILATGHSGCGPDAYDRRCASWAEVGRQRNPRCGYLRSAYPIGNLSAVRPESRVLVSGTGLSAADVLSELTVGRGGEFDRYSQERYKYVASCHAVPLLNTVQRFVSHT